MTNTGLHVDLRTTIDNFVLECQFEAPKGSSVAVVGPNGSGKSTLLRALAGLADIDRGKVAIADVVVADFASGVDVPPESRSIALMHQRALLFPHLSVADNVMFGLRYSDRTHQRRLSPTPRQWRREHLAIADKALNDVGLAQFGDRKPSELSGGQQQRVALARALVVKSDLLLIDEPLSNVDADSRLLLRSAMQKWRPDAQVQVVVTHGHDHSQAADYVLGLDAGRVVAFGPPHQLARETKLDWLRDLLNASD